MEKAYQDYLKKKKDYIDDVKDETVSEENVEIAKYRLGEARQEYGRARRDFNYAVRERRVGSSEKLSIDKNDVHKKIRHHKVEIKSLAKEMPLDDFNNYIDNLTISTTPVNPNASKDAVKEAQNAIKDTR